MKDKAIDKIQREDILRRHKERLQRDQFEVLKEMKQRESDRLNHVTREVRSIADRQQTLEMVKANNSKLQAHTLQRSQNQSRAEQAKDYFKQQAQLAKSQEVTRTQERGRGMER